MDIKFLRGTAEQYAAATKNDGTFYYTTDTHKLYLGTYELTTEDDIKNAVTLVNSSDKGNEKLYQEITKLEGNAETEGSIASLLAALKTTIEGEVVNTLTAADDSVEVSGTATAKTVAAKISAAANNSLSLRTVEGEEGLYVNVPAGVNYTVSVTESSPEGYAKAYTFSQLGSTIATVNIPKDMVVESGEVVVDPQGQPAGTYLKLVLANADEDEIYINVGDLIEYVTSGSQAGDMVVIDIDAQHKVTATITDGTITKAKLDNSVQTSLNKADSALQVADITEGATNGTIDVKGTEVSIHGLGSAAYTASTAYDAAGAAAAVKGASGDAATAETVYGAKAYADSLATNYDAAGSASTAETNAKAYADELLTWGTISE